jgi:hypothetical protein
MPTIEENNSISFLNLLITRQPSAIEIDIYRKPTTTDTTINYTSNHPTEHKLAVYCYLISRMTALPLSQEKEEAEWQTILITANNNNFPISIIKKLKTKIHNKEPTKNNEHKKWATFTYHSTKVRKITNLFKHTNTKIAFKSTNTIGQKTKRKNHHSTQNMEQSGIYKLTCKTCHKAYIGQTSRSLTARFREHTRYIKNNNPQSAYALHILENLHKYGTINDTMTLLQPVNNTAMLLPYEQLFIQNYYHKEKLIPEQHRSEPNPLLQLAYDTDTMTHI